MAYQPIDRGSVTFRMECYPAFNYARDAHETNLTPEGALFSSQGCSLALSASVSLWATDRAAAAEFMLREGEKATFTLGARTAGAENQSNPCSEQEADALLRGTSMQGVFAAGDVRAGSTKQVASAVGEGATAALMIRQFLEKTEGSRGYTGD